MSITAIYPGTFDPVTNGHTDLVQRASKLFDKVIVAVASNSQKGTTFSLDERIKLVKTALSGLNNVTICGFDSLLVDFARESRLRLFCVVYERYPILNMSFSWRV